LLGLSKKIYFDFHYVLELRIKHSALNPFFVIRTVAIIIIIPPMMHHAIKSQVLFFYSTITQYYYLILLLYLIRNILFVNSLALTR